MLQRPHKSIPEKVKPFGWLAQCLLLHLKQLVTTEEFCAASPFLQTFPILKYVLACFQTLHACDGPYFISPALSKKQS
jgi:hypothetical protein